MQDNFEESYQAWLDSMTAMSRYQKLFITGCPKSGTTWLLNLLNGHPNIVAGGEGRFAWRLYSPVQQAVNHFNEDHRTAGGAGEAMVRQEDLSIYLRVMTDSILHRYLLASGKSAGDVRVIADKTPQHVLSYGVLNGLYPDCRFINIVRDPRDAATSALFHLAAGSPQGRSEYVESFIGTSWRVHVESAIAGERDLGTSRFLNIRYEDLHADEPGTVRRCLTMLGLDASDPAVAKCRASGDFSTRAGGRRRGQTDATSFFRNGQVGDWRNHLAPGLAHRCCVPVAKLMERFGYAMEKPGVKVTVYSKALAAAAA
jgi:hypothetical protein